MRSTDTDRKHSSSSSKVLGTLPHESILYYAARNSHTHKANSSWDQLPYKIHKLQTSYITSGKEQKPVEYSYKMAWGMKNLIQFRKKHLDI